EILEECVACGGSVTGEHGIGVEKIDFMPRLFTPEDLAMMLRLRSAFNPEGRCSPRKMLPTAGACIEPTKAGRRAAVWQALAPRQRRRVEWRCEGSQEVVMSPTTLDEPGAAPVRSVVSFPLSHGRLV